MTDDNSPKDQSSESSTTNPCDATNPSDVADAGLNAPAAVAPKRENIWLNIGLNVLIPSVLLSKGEDWFEAIGLFRIIERLGVESVNKPAVVLVVALLFPIAYGIYDFVTRRKYNFFSILGFVSILISGGVGLMKIDKDWIAVKEAAIPALFAIATLVSLWTPFPLIRTFLYNPEIFDVPKIETALAEKKNEANFDKLIKRCTMYLVGSFILSAILNYVLAKYLIHSETGTEAFNQELGKLTLWSWPVITVPSMAVMMYALMQLVGGIEKFTGYEMEDVVLVGAPKEKAKKADDAKPDDAKPDDAKPDDSEGAQPKAS